jgi:molybdenum cofactor synthesis domain-containing protein
MTSNSPQAAIIVIGNEILSGRTQDKNVNYMALELGKLGIRLLEVRVIPDIRQTIIDTVNEMRAKFDYVFTTGGIGPTHDDITSEAVAAAFGAPLVTHERSLQKMNDYYKGELNEGRIKMTMLPQGAIPVENPISVAPGFQIGNVFVMAGIPNVMQAMFDSLKGGLKSGAVILSKEMKIFGSESKIAKALRELQERNMDIDIGSYPFVQDAKIGTSLVLRGTDANRLDKVYAELSEVIPKVNL